MSVSTMTVSIMSTSTITISRPFWIAMFILTTRSLVIFFVRAFFDLLFIFISISGIILAISGMVV